MRRCVRRQPAAGLLELALATDLVAPAGLIPRHRDVHQPLEEVALFRLGRAPRVLELFVGGEELAAADQLEAVLERLSGRP
jgi:hypothetical protein